MLCYARYGSERMTDAELEENLARGGLTLRRKIGEDPSDWNTPGTQAYFATSDEFAVLAFRGTEADDPDDLHSDLDILLVPEPNYRASSSPPLGHLSLIEHLFSLPCMVHQGFRSALNRVWSQVQEILSDYRKENPTREICLTGHSLGGALALLTYSRCADDSMSAITIGCPRIGDGAFRGRVAECPGKGHFRIVNFNDLVAHVPLESALYAHAPRECYRFDDSGILSLEKNDILSADIGVLARTIGGLPKDLRTNMKLLEGLPAPPGLVDHSPSRYCMRLWDCVPD